MFYLACYDPRNQGNIYMNEILLTEADFLREQGKDELAIAAYEAYEQGASGALKQVAILGKCLSLVALARKKEARELLNTCAPTPLDPADDATRMRYKDLYSQCNFAMERHEQAYASLKSLVELEDKIHNEKISHKLKEINDDYEMEKRKYKSINIMDMASRLASIGVIVGSIVHEINQPLSAISVNASSITYWDQKNNGYLPESIVNASLVISEAVKSISEIVSHMRQYWTLKENEPLGAIDLNWALERTLELVSSQMVINQVEWVTNYYPDLLEIACNRLHLEQVMINLIAYLLQQVGVSDHKQTLIIETHRLSSVAIIDMVCNWSEFQSRPELDEWDNIPASSSEDLSLGLVIVRQALERFRGSIRHFQDEVGRECFTISFPLAEYGTQGDMI